MPSPQSSDPVPLLALAPASTSSPFPSPTSTPSSPLSTPPSTISPKPSSPGPRDKPDSDKSPLLSKATAASIARSSEPQPAPSPEIHTVFSASLITSLNARHHIYVNHTLGIQWSAMLLKKHWEKLASWNENGQIGSGPARTEAYEVAKGGKRKAEAEVESRDSWGGNGGKRKRIKRGQEELGQGWEQGEKDEWGQQEGNQKVEQNGECGKEGKDQGKEPGKQKEQRQRRWKVNKGNGEMGTDVPTGLGKRKMQMKAEMNGEWEKGED